ncbi:hypothetical protein NIIDMKKI_28590 [Mycobacterium kansasii]|uniref:Transposase DDE domain-containing protein n=1 Tax=Mycobacterium kansasii TaxID=1768 RepID=A0A7G1IBG6_MYCKA|nr:hypothetical protein NIIDMKKI_28590 [Mycobacterium kansasii]
MHIDIDATLVLDHSDNKEVATPTWKKSFGLHPLLAFLDRPEIAGGKALAGLLRTGRAGSNTAADHITVLDEALASLPSAWRPDPGRGGDRDAPKVLVRCDSAGATHDFAGACRAAGGVFLRLPGGLAGPRRRHGTTQRGQPANPNPPTHEGAESTTITLDEKSRLICRDGLLRGHGGLVLMSSAGQGFSCSPGWRGGRTPRGQQGPTPKGAWP